MRINTDGRYGYRLGLYGDTGNLFGENTRSKAIDASCKFTREMLPALAKATEHPESLGPYQ